MPISPIKGAASTPSRNTALSRPSTAVPNLNGFRGDAAAVLCAYLILKNGFTCARIAHNLGLPPLVVEECVRNGESSAALRAQLGHWLQENTRAATGLPHELVRLLTEECTDDELRQQKSARVRSEQSKGSSPTMSPRGGPVGGGRSGSEDAEPLFSTLDPLSRQHFTALRNSVGHSFISILNDPREDTESAHWGSWLGGKLYDAFDYNGRTPTGRLDEAMRILATQEQTNPESSSSLLLLHPLQTDFGAYVKEVAAAYSTNQKENRELQESVFLDNRAHPEHLPWPKDVPQEFFDREYSARGEVEQLPAPLLTEDKLTQLLPTTTTGKGAEDLSALQAVKVVGPNTFVRDYEALEERNKELRGWEAEVERCLLQHVQSRSEDFFIASREFNELNAEGAAAKEEASAARTGGIKKGTASIQELLGIGALYRRRRNFDVLHAFLERAIKIRKQLQDIENWVSLPERELSELPTVARQLVELEAFLKAITVQPTPEESQSKETDVSAAATSEDPSSSPRSPMSPMDSWKWMSHLKVLKEVPHRAMLARRNLSTLVQTEVSTCLSRDQANPAEWSRTVRAIEASALLGELEASLLTFQTTLIQAQWSAVQENFVGFLMSTNALDDAKANELLAISSASASLAEQTTEKKKELFAFSNVCPFSAFEILLSQLIGVLVLDITRATQNWGFVLVECFPKALAMYGDAGELALRATRNVLGALCNRAEFLLTILLDVRGSSKTPLDAGDLEKVARMTIAFLPQALAPLKQLVAVSTFDLQALVSSDSEAVQLGKLARASLVRLAKRCLKKHHETQIEKIRVVVESETWAPKEDIDSSFQAHVEQLCKSDEAAVTAFDARSLESEGAQGNVDCRDADTRSARRHTSSTTSKEGKGNESDTDLMGVKATKLYLSLDGEDDGRVVANSLLILTEVICGYDDFLSRFPSVSFDVVSKVYELLALYESLSVGMVLGARAMEKGTLKTITTTHLSVASQCLAFLADLIPKMQERLLAVLRVKDGETSPTAVASSTTTAKKAAPARKLLPFITDDLDRVAQDCRSHRNEYYHKMSTLVVQKVDSLGLMEPNGQWTARGNEWVMTMLREVARLIRTLRTLLPPPDVQGVIVTLLSSLAVKIREVTRCVPESSVDSRAMAKSDVLLFKLNIERFGYDVLRCAAVSSVSDAMSAEDLAPKTSDEDAIAWFFPRAASPASAAPAKPQQQQKPAKSQAPPSSPS